jgi:hypothetical protein
MSIRIATGRTISTSPIMPISTGHSEASAVSRSGASISETSRPMNSGITVSSSATAKLAANMAEYQPFVCRMKCQ